MTLQIAKTGQIQTLHQRVRTIKESAIAPDEWNNVAIKDDKKDH